MPGPDPATPTEGVRTADMPDPKPDLIHDLTLRSIAHTLDRVKKSMHGRKDGIDSEAEALAYAKRLALAIGTAPNDADETSERAVALWHQMYDEREYEKPHQTHTNYYTNALAVLTHDGDVQLALIYMLMAVYEALILPSDGASIAEEAEMRRRRG